MSYMVLPRAASTLFFYLLATLCVRQWSQMALADSRPDSCAIVVQSTSHDSPLMPLQRVVPPEPLSASLQWPIQPPFPRTCLLLPPCF